MILIQRFTKLPVFRQLSSKELKKVKEPDMLLLLLNYLKKIKIQNEQKNITKKQFNYTLNTI